MKNKYYTESVQQKTGSEVQFPYLLTVSCGKEGLIELYTEKEGKKKRRWKCK